jgi:hypothetical protein
MCLIFLCLGIITRDGGRIGSPGAVSIGEGGHVPSSLHWPSEVLVAHGARAAYCSALVGYRVLFLCFLGPGSYFLGML